MNAAKERSAIFRFLVAGATNTAVTGLALSLLALLMDYRFAYAVVFSAGIVLSTVLAGRFVFRRTLTPARVISYIAVYVLIFITGLLVLSWWNRLGLPPWGSGAIVAVTAPLGYFGGRLVFWRSGDKPA